MKNSKHKTVDFEDSINRIVAGLKEAKPIAFKEELQAIEALGEIKYEEQDYQVQVVFEPRKDFWVDEKEIRFRLNMAEPETQTTELAVEIKNDGQTVRAINNYIAKSFAQLENIDLEDEGRLSEHLLYSSLKIVLEMYEQNLQESNQ
jgi:hypothetical protein